MPFPRDQRNASGQAIVPRDAHDGLEIDHEGFPSGHYRGRGEDQSGTGPAGRFLQGGPARFMIDPRWDRATPRGAADGGSSERRSSEGRRTREGQRGRGPKNYQRSDARILEDVCEALADHGDLDASEIEVSVEERVVRLGGSVSSRHAKFLAESLAASVTGVEDVLNDVRIARARSASAETSMALYASTAHESRR